MGLEGRLCYKGARKLFHLGEEFCILGVVVAIQMYALSKPKKIYTKMIRYFNNLTFKKKRTM